MNWYKQSKTESFADKIICIAATDTYLVLAINGKRYRYEGLNGKQYCYIIDGLKTNKNKMDAGRIIHNIFKSIEPYLINNFQ